DRKTRELTSRPKAGKVAFFIEDPSFHINHVPIYLFISYHGKQKKRRDSLTESSGFNICLTSVGLPLLSYLTPKSANCPIAFFLPVKCTAWSPWALASATLSRRSSIKTALEGSIWKSLI